MKSAILHVGVNLSSTNLAFNMALPVFKDWSYIFIPISGSTEGMTYDDL